MDKIVFDASAILTLLKKEKGHEIVDKYLDNAVVSTVNFSEVVTVLNRSGVTQDIIQYLGETFLHIEEFNIEQAIIAASIDEITKKNGLSLGDRSCLALAKSMSLPVLTADKIWKNVNLGIDIQLIR